MKRIISIFLLLIAAGAAVALYGSPANAASEALEQSRKANAQLINQLQNELATKKTSADSVRILFNIFDLTDSWRKTEIGFQLAATATRAGNEEVAMDALRNVANLNMQSDSITDLVEQMVKKYPPSSDRTYTLTFVNMIRDSYVAGKGDNEQRRMERLQKQLREVDSLSSPKSVYDKVVMLHAVCANLADLSEGNMLKEYLGRLGQMVEALPQDEVALRNAYYVSASLFYTRAGLDSLAIEADRKLLAEIDKLEVRCKKMGRIYKDYGANRYVIYTRMLQNYKALTPDEIEKYYRLAMLEVDKNARAKATYESNPVPSAIYAFYRSDYETAFELLQRCKDVREPSPRRLQLPKMYLEAAKAIGNREALVDFYPDYIDLLEKQLSRQKNERMRELQVAYDVNEIRTENMLLKNERQDSNRRLWRAATIICGVLLLVLVVFVFIMWRIIRRKQHLAMKLKAANESLAKESNDLREARTELEIARDYARQADRIKTDFISNMSHEVKVPLQAMQEYAMMIVENADDSRKKFISKFADRLTTNCALVNTIVNDVLQLSELSNHGVKVKLLPHSVKEIVESSVDTIRSHVANGVKIKVAGDEDLVLTTDRTRLIQILTNLLTNAAKFTSEGVIFVEYGRSGDGRNAIFEVTDTGVGIDPANSEVIFERFMKLDKSQPGVGLGLTISRMLAKVLGGTLELDKEYTGGARFVLTLPME